MLQAAVASRNPRPWLAKQGDIVVLSLNFSEPLSRLDVLLGDITATTEGGDGRCPGSFHAHIALYKLKRLDYIRVNRTS